MTSERQRRKEEAAALAIAHAAMRSETTRMIFTDEATAKRLFDRYVRIQKREAERLDAKKRGL